jgi:tRNA threonylcarbamoyl adenosine modification protein YeaZ
VKAGDGGIMLAMDTATRRAALALGTGAGKLIAERSWECGHRPGQELLATLDDLLSRSGVVPGQLAVVVVGTGPGAFTGLRVGLSTAKALAHGLGCPIVGIPSTLALAEAAWRLAGAGVPRDLTVILPAGPRDRYVASYRWPVGGADRKAESEAGSGPDGDEGAAEPQERGEPRLLAAAEAAGALAAGGLIVAVDLAAGEGIDERSLDIGRQAQEGLGRALLRIGRRRVARGAVDDVALLVPAYVTLPRGIAAERGAIGWSSDRR